MSDFVYIQSMLEWVQEARFAVVSKNAVRKELLDSFKQCFVPVCSSYTNIDRDSIFKMHPSFVVRITTFLNLDGKSDNVSDDQRLQFATCVNEILNQLRNYLAMKERDSPGSFEGKINTPIEISQMRRLPRASASAVSSGISSPATPSGQEGPELSPKLPISSFVRPTYKHPHAKDVKPKSSEAWESSTSSGQGSSL